MTDINFEDSLGDDETVALIELMFFAYRDFVSDPDTVLEQLGFGRAHHRVLHFANRHQVLPQTEHFPTDRRQRLLHLTAAGEELRQSLMAPQMSRIRRAVSETSDNGRTSMRDMLYHLVSPENRDGVKEWIDGAGKPGAKPGE